MLEYLAILYRDRQTDIHRHIETDTDIQADRQTESTTRRTMDTDCRMTDEVNQRWNTSQYSIETYRHTYIETQTQTYRHTDRQTDI